MSTKDKVISAPAAATEHADVSARIVSLLAGTPLRTYVTMFCILALAALSLYWPAVLGGLVSDDWGLSAPDKGVWRSFLGYWFGGGKGAFYRPFSRLFIYYQARIFGYSGIAQHLISMALFFATVFITGRIVLKWRGVWPALLCITLLLFSHIQTNAVAWVSSQTDLLAAFFLALLAARVADDPRNLTLRNVWLSLIFSVCAYLSKDSAAILGPLAFTYLAVVVLQGGLRGLRERRNALILGAGNLALFVLYMGFRKWRLGQFGGLSEPGFAPKEGMLWHGSQYYLSALREYLVPLIRDFPATPSADVPLAGALWPVLLTAALLAWVFLQRNLAALFCGVAWLVGMLPLLTLMVPFYYPETGLNDILRYLYVPTYFLAAFAAFLLPAIPSDRMPNPSFGFAALLILALLNGTLAQKTINDYSNAGKQREAILQALRSNLGESSQANLYVRRTPDSIGRAYLFRNGFPEFVRIHLPNVKIVDAAAFDPAQAPSTSFIFDSTDGRSISIRRFEEPAKAASFLNSAGPPPPYMIDFARNIKTIAGLGNSSSVEILSNADSEMILRIIGPDPYLSFAPIKKQPYYAYRRALLKIELLDALPEQQSQSDVVHFLWALATDNDPRSFPFVESRANLAPGVQTFDFNLQRTLAWHKDGDLKLLRFDLPAKYRGRIRIHALGLE